ncbi:MAG: hypothetical protein E6I87_03470 [Chloroflexi bacterium]|nr:MAG: hypothetical protein E6I87_03470 [Chloroflexota bacterium]
MIERVRLIVVSIAILTLMLGSPASAHTAVVADPVGDMATAASPAFDIVQAKVTERKGAGILYFQLELAAPVTETTGFGAWAFLVNAPAGSATFYGVVVRHCDRQVQAVCGANGYHWESALLTATGTTVGAFGFSVDGATVKAYVDPALLGDVGVLRWSANTRNAPAGGGSRALDFAPNSGFVTLER